MIKHTLTLLIAAASMAAIPQASAETANCLVLSNTVKTTVAASKSRVLELTSTYVAQNESCACEIVKAAIVASDANATLVANIVESAIIASPSQIRLIGQCAVAVAPDAYDQVQAVVNKYSGNETYEATTYSAKGGSDEKDAVAGDEAFEDNPSRENNPLNLAGGGGGGLDGVGGSSPLLASDPFFGPGVDGLVTLIPQPPTAPISNASDEAN